MVEDLAVVGQTLDIMELKTGAPDTGVTGAGVTQAAPSLSSVEAEEEVRFVQHSRLRHHQSSPLTFSQWKSVWVWWCRVTGTN